MMPSSNSKPTIPPTTMFRAQKELTKLKERDLQRRRELSKKLGAGTRWIVTDSMGHGYDKQIVWSWERILLEIGRQISPDSE